MIYKAIGKAVVKLAVLFIRRRYARQLQVIGALIVASIIAGGYLATRSVEEG